VLEEDGEERRSGLPAGVAHERYPAAARRGRLQPVVTRDGREGSLRLRQDALARGTITACGETLGAGDGLAMPAGTITLDHGRDAEVLVFDHPGT
jgi:hypothetical protein